MRSGLRARNAVWPDELGGRDELGGPAVRRDDGTMTSGAQRSVDQVDVGEAARQLQQAAHDARVAYDCIA